jgi:hypothetical protein
LQGIMLRSFCTDIKAGIKRLSIQPHMKLPAR